MAVGHLIYLAAPVLNCGMQDWVSWSGIEPGHPALGAWSLGPWTTREVPLVHLIGIPILVTWPHMPLFILKKGWDRKILNNIFFIIIYFPLPYINDQMEWEQETGKWTLCFHLISWTFQITRCMPCDSGIISVLLILAWTGQNKKILPQSVVPMVFLRLSKSLR